MHELMTWLLMHMPYTVWGEMGLALVQLNAQCSQANHCRKAATGAELGRQLCRDVIGQPLTPARLLHWPWPPRPQLPLPILVFVAFVPWPLFLLNLMWFSKIVRGALKLFLGTAEEQVGALRLLQWAGRRARGRAGARARGRAGGRAGCS